MAIAQHAPINATKRSHRAPDANKQRYRIEVGHSHGVKPGNIVGAIANESGLDGEHIGQIEIEENFSLVDLPVGMPKDVFMDLKKVMVCGQRLAISRWDVSGSARVKAGKPKSRPKNQGKTKKRAEKRAKPRPGADRARAGKKGPE